MPLDTTIPLQVRPPEFENPMNAFARMQQLQNAQQQNALNELTMQEKQRLIQENEALNKAYSNAFDASGNLDRQKLTANIIGANQGAKLPAIQKMLSDQDKSALETQKLQLENAHKKVQGMASLFNGVTDQSSFDKAKAESVRMFGPDSVAHMPAMYNPNDIQQRQQQAMTVAEHITNQWKKLDYDLNLNKFDYQKTNDAANRGVTMRGQNMVDARAKTSNDLRLMEINSKGTNATEDERKAAGWLAQATNAFNNMAGVLSKDQSVATPGPMEAMAGSMGLSGTANWARSPSRQQFVQASKSFSEAALRAATGAGMNEYEARQKIEELTPQWTDSKEVKEQKLSSLSVYLDAIQTRAGRALQPGMVPPRLPMQIGDQPAPASQMNMIPTNQPPISVLMSPEIRALVKQYATPQR